MGAQASLRQRVARLEERLQRVAPEKTPRPVPDPRAELVSWYAQHGRHLQVPKSLVAEVEAERARLRELDRQHARSLAERAEASWLFGDPHGPVRPST